MIFKKAQGHVEMMLSFVLFIGAVITIFFFMNPFSEVQTETFDSQEVYNLIIENVSQEIGEVFVSMSSGCYNIQQSDYGISYTEVLDGNKVRIYFSSVSGTFEDILTKSDLCLAGYKLGSHSKDDYVVNGSLVLLKESYEDDYVKLKKDLGISRDFEFVVKDLDWNVIDEFSVARESSTGLNVDAVEYPVSVINKEGVVDEYILNVRVW